MPPTITAMHTATAMATENAYETFQKASSAVFNASMAVIQAQKSLTLANISLRDALATKDQAKAKYDTLTQSESFWYDLLFKSGARAYKENAA